MRLQTRDKEILEYICKFRCLTTQQIGNLFNINIKVCQRRLRVLCKAGYLNKRPIPSTAGNSPNLFYLGKEGLFLLKVRALRPRFGLLFSHQQKNSTLLINMFNSVRNSFVKCELLPEHLIRRKGELEIIPDGAFKLSKNGKGALLLIENDLDTEIIKSTMYHPDIETKILKYIEMFRNNDVEFYNNYFKCRFQRFRVLIIVSTSKRFKAINSLIKEYDENGFILISDFTKFNENPCVNIWQAPGVNKTDLSIV